VRPGYDDRAADDPQAAFTHYYFPDYLITPPARAGAALALSDWTADPDWSRPAFFYAGTRCYARFRTRGAPPPHGDNLQPACARLRRDFALEPVLEWDAPNRGDVWLDYYGDAPTLHLGLYLIRPRTE
jgi:hypothetical protein